MYSWKKRRVSGASEAISSMLVVEMVLSVNTVPILPAAESRIFMKVLKKNIYKGNNSFCVILSN